MTSPGPVLFAAPEHVLAAWISSIPGFAADSVAPELPADDTAWKRNGAVTMLVVGGTEHPAMAVSKTVLQVECWRCNPGSNKPLWPESRNMADHIRLACKDRVNVKRALQVQVNGVPYPGASVEGIAVLSAARRGYGLRSDYAMHMLDVAMTWVQALPALITR